MAERIVPIKKAEASYHPYAECADKGCDWAIPAASWARDDAKHHIRATGHSVHVIVQKVALWGPK